MLFCAVFQISLDTYSVFLGCSNSWMITQNVSLWEQTMWDPSRCSKSVCPCVGRLLC